MLSIKTYSYPFVAIYSKAMLLNKFDFKFKGKPEDVGMQTGATIHTMNGLNMFVEKSTEVPSTSGYWEMQHTKRGFSATGSHRKITEDVNESLKP